MTRWVWGRRLWISMSRSILSTEPSGFLLNLYAPWLVPMAMARASTPVRSANSTAWSGSVTCSRPVPPASVAVFNAAEDADFAFDGDAALVGEFDDSAGDFDVLFKVGRGLAVGLQRAVHHDAR